MTTAEIYLHIDTAQEINEGERKRFSQSTMQICNYSSTMLLILCWSIDIIRCAVYWTWEMYINSH